MEAPSAAGDRQTNGPARSEGQGTAHHARNGSVEDGTATAAPAAGPSRPLPSRLPGQKRVSSAAAMAPGVFSISSDTASGENSTDEMPTKKRRRRRMLDELTFSSPGPAFLDSANSTEDDAPMREDSDADGDTAVGSAASSSFHRRPTRRSRLSNGAHVEAAPPSPLAIVVGMPDTPTTGAPSRSNQSPARRSNEPTAASSAATMTSKARTKSSTIFRNYTPKRAPWPSPQSRVGDFSQPSKGKERALDSGEPETTLTEEPSRAEKRARRPSSRLRDEQEGTASSQPDTPPRQRAVASPSSTFHRRTVKQGQYDKQAPSMPGNSRANQILSRKRDLVDRVYGDHDMLVRELFHLHKFVTLVGYDPEVSTALKSVLLFLS